MTHSVTLNSLFMNCGSFEELKYLFLLFYGSLPTTVHVFHVWFWGLQWEAVMTTIWNTLTWSHNALTVAVHVGCVGLIFFFLYEGHSSIVLRVGALKDLLDFRFTLAGERACRRTQVLIDGPMVVILPEPRLCLNYPPPPFPPPPPPGLTLPIALWWIILHEQRPSVSVRTSHSGFMNKGNSFVLDSRERF